MANLFIDTLLYEHKRMHRVLDLMQQQVSAMESGRLPDMKLFGFALDYLSNLPVAIHHPKEDLMYYHMYLREPAFKPEVHHMLAQHRQIHELERRLADAGALVIGRGAIFHSRLMDLSREYLRLQKAHREIEERILFPRARWLLTSQDWAYLNSPADELQEPLFTARDVKRFESLFLYLTRELPNGDRATGSCLAGAWETPRRPEFQPT